ncbi:hypothetical protein CCP3SC15_1170013 [Gammaproteobacteria bacterium]
MLVGTNNSHFDFVMSINRLEWILSGAYQQDINPSIENTRVQNAEALRDASLRLGFYRSSPK